jgi:hypothetical protein
VLLCYADAAPKPPAPQVAWLGLERLHDITRLDQKTITAARRALKDVHGYLIDTGERRGTSGRVTVFRMNLANTTGNGGIAAVDNGRPTREKRMGLGGEIPPNSESNAPENGGSDPPENGDRICSMNLPGTGSALGAEEVAPTKEHFPEPAPRTDGFESPIAKLRREMPHLAHILPGEEAK